MRKAILNIFLFLVTIYALGCSYYLTQADYSKQEVLNQKIEKFCKLHPLANEYSFGQKNYIRCALIGQAQLEFESRGCEINVGNNCFNFKSRGIKQYWYDDFGVYNIRNSFLIFPDKTNSIKFYVDRYYLYDKNKKIEQIIKDFTFTKSDRDNYIFFTKEYFRNNLYKYE